VRAHVVERAQPTPRAGARHPEVVCAVKQPGGHRSDWRLLACNRLEKARRRPPNTRVQAKCVPRTRLGLPSMMFGGRRSAFSLLCKRATAVRADLPLLLTASYPSGWRAPGDSLAPRLRCRRAYVLSRDPPATTCSGLRRVSHPASPRTSGARADAAQRCFALDCRRTRADSRVHLDTMVDDWLMNAAFAFDQATVLRGLASAGRAWLARAGFRVDRTVVCLRPRPDRPPMVLLRACIPHLATPATIPMRPGRRQRGPFCPARLNLNPASSVCHFARSARAAEATPAAASTGSVRSSALATHALLYTWKVRWSDPDHCRRPPRSTRWPTTEGIARPHVVLGFVPEDAVIHRSHASMRRAKRSAQSYCFAGKAARWISACSQAADLRCCGRMWRADCGIPFDFEHSPVSSTA